MRCWRAATRFIKDHSHFAHGSFFFHLLGLLFLHNVFFFFIKVSAYCVNILGEKHDRCLHTYMKELKREK